MYLSHLALHGFKSFAEPTELQFADGVTAIVGPNGCGKSNIVDAVRWVVGEQRPTALRSKAMEHVIFNGTAGRRPLGMADVELTIENNRGVLPVEYTEVSIGRRLFRDGTSEYLMNGRSCRLKDITDLFMDTGMGADAYSVIELKMIDEILSESASDRRRLFEEAAGITRYKERRRQALRKLDNTQADLTRIRDLTDEIAGKVRRLKRQADEAAAHRAHAERLHTLELRLARAEYARLSKKRNALHAERSSLEAEGDERTAMQQKLENRLAALRETLTEREHTLAGRREAMQAGREAVRDLEGEQRLQQERLQTARSTRTRLIDEQEADAARRENVTQEQARLRAESEEAKPAVQEVEAALEAAEADRAAARRAAEAKREALRPLRRKAQEADAARAEHRRALDRRLSHLEHVEQEQERARERLEALDDEADALEDRLRHAASAQAEARDAAGEARRALEALRTERKEKQQALNDAEEQLRRTERRRDATAAEVDLLENLVASYDELSDAVQFLAESSEETLNGAAGPLHTVADVLACDEFDRAALGAALGALSACVVVETEAQMQRAIERLRAAEAGRASFLVLERLAPPPPSPPDAASAKPLRSVVRVTDEAYARLPGALLSNKYVVNSLEEAQTYAADSDASGGAAFYARSGEWVDARGIVRGGGHAESASPAARRLGRQEQLEDARRRLSTLEADCADRRADAEACREAHDALAVGECRAALDEAERILAEAEKECERLRYDKGARIERREELSDRMSALDEELREHRTAAERLRSQTEAAAEQQQALRAEREDAEAAFEEADAARREAQDACHDAEVAAVEARNRLDALRREREGTHERLQELKDRAEMRTDELATLRHTIEAAQERQTALQQEIDDARAHRNAHEEAVEEADDALTATKQEIENTERCLRRARQAREEAVREENRRAVRLAEITTRLEDLVESTREDFAVDLAEEKTPPLTEYSSTEEDQEKARIQHPAVYIPLNPPSKGEVVRASASQVRRVPGDGRSPLDDAFDEAAAQREVAALREELQKLGSVNPLALEEYEEQKERLDFLTEQQDDLERAEDTLLDTISEINTTAAERFDETFGAIKDNFGTLFERLFGAGASATLQLENEDDPLESTIEIIAQPRGKKPSLLTQLSSGEKALTAIALLFAIYLVKPSPFCILDEVDAPLDDANTGRFMNLIREFSDRTQFILVTHNKRTMELADRLYGVTMQEQGVSTLVGVAFDEALTLAEAA